MAIWKGSHNPILKGDLQLTMVINHLRPSWDDPPRRGWLFGWYAIVDEDFLGISYQTSESLWKWLTGSGKQLVISTSSEVNLLNIQT